MSEADEKKNNLWSLRKKQEPNLTGDPGKSLMGEVEKLRDAVLALVTINQQLCKKIEANQTCLEALARAQSNDNAVFGVI
jgi:hypothetical protein